MQSLLDLEEAVPLRNAEVGMGARPGPQPSAPGNGVWLTSWCLRCTFCSISSAIRIEISGPPWPPEANMCSQPAVPDSRTQSHQLSGPAADTWKGQGASLWSWPEGLSGSDPPGSCGDQLKLTQWAVCLSARPVRSCLSMPRVWEAGRPQPCVLLFLPLRGWGTVTCSFLLTEWLAYSDYIFNS